MSILEEELLLEEEPLEIKLEPNQILINQVLALFNQGLDIHQIAKQSSLSLETVRDILSRRL
ncbi:helix-turn-helix domain-containing protein [Bacillus sp. N9]